MQPEKNIIDCYNRTAAAYAAQYSGELKHKPLDQQLLFSFAAGCKESDIILDLGCGPGQTTRYLADAGVKNITGIDLSPGMVAAAAAMHPDLSFRTGNMLALEDADRSVDGIVAFYAIVHFNTASLSIAIQEMARVLKPGGKLFLSFHAGTDIIHRDEFLGETVNIDFHFFEPQVIRELLLETGFTRITITERNAYPEVEYPSRRAYVQAERKVN